MGQIPLYFYVPMERLFDGMDQENSKTRGKGQIRKIQKNKKERMEERKRRDFYVHGGSHTCVFLISQEHPRAILPQENPLVWGPPLQQNHRHMVQSIFPPERTQKLPQSHLPRINIHPGKFHTIHPGETLVHCNPVPYLTMVNSYILTIHVHIYPHSNHQVPYLRLT